MDQLGLPEEKVNPNGGERSLLAGSHVQSGAAAGCTCFTCTGSRCGRAVPGAGSHGCPAPRRWRRGAGASAAPVRMCAGAIALGHPAGATGVRQTVTLLHELARRQASDGQVGRGGAGSELGCGCWRWRCRARRLHASSLSCCLRVCVRLPLRQSRPCVRVPLRCRDQSTAWLPCVR